MSSSTQQKQPTRMRCNLIIIVMRDGWSAASIFPRKVSALKCRMNARGQAAVLLRAEFTQGLRVGAPVVQERAVSDDGQITVTRPRWARS